MYAATGGRAPLAPRWRRLWDGTGSYREFIPSPSYVQNELVHSLAEYLTPVNKVNNLNANYLKILKTHRGPHKMPSRAICDPRAACLRSLPHTV